jgi:hypothetical protein
MRVAIFTVLLSLNFSEPSRAADERQIRRDCTWDALRYCKVAIPMGREAIIECMIVNKDKLQPKCRRHLWQ